MDLITNSLQALINLSVYFFNTMTVYLLNKSNFIYLIFCLLYPFSSLAL
jgi:hypothetical protein